MPEFTCPRLDLLEDLANPPPVPKSIIGGHFIERNLNIVSGQPGSYKTICMLEVASAIALGRPAFGIFPVHTGRVVFVTGDDPKEVVIDRLLALNADDDNGKRVLRQDVLEKLARNIDVFPLDQVIEIRNKPINRWLRSIFTGATMAIMDPLRHFIGEADENKSNEIYSQLSPLRQMATDIECAIVAIHHSKKSSAAGGDTASKLNDFRGSGAIRGLSRAQLNIERTNYGVDPPIITIVGENRFNVEPADLTLEVQRVGSTIRFIRPSLVDLVHRHLVEIKKPQSTNEILAAFQEPAGAIRSALKRLRERQLLTSYKDGKQSIWSPTRRIDTSVSGAATETDIAEHRKHTEQL